MWVVITKRLMPSGNAYEIKRRDFAQWDQLIYYINKVMWKQENQLDIIRIEKDIDAVKSKIAHRRNKHR